MHAAHDQRYTVALASLQGPGRCRHAEHQIYGLYGQDPPANCFDARNFGADPALGPTPTAPMRSISCRIPEPAGRVHRAALPGHGRASGSPSTPAAGKYRGGLGYVKELRTLVDGHYTTVTEHGVRLSINGGRWAHPAADQEPGDGRRGARLLQPRRGTGQSRRSDPPDHAGRWRLGAIRWSGISRRYGSTCCADSSGTQAQCAIMASDGRRYAGRRLGRARALRADKAARRGAPKLIDRGPYAETLIRRLARGQRSEVECLIARTRCWSIIERSLNTRRESPTEQAHTAHSRAFYSGAIPENPVMIAVASPIAYSRIAAWTARMPATIATGSTCCWCGRNLRRGAGPRRTVRCVGTLFSAAR